MEEGGERREKERKGKVKKKEKTKKGRKEKKIQTM